MKKEKNKKAPKQRATLKREDLGSWLLVSITWLNVIWVKNVLAIKSKAQDFVSKKSTVKVETDSKPITKKYKSEESGAVFPHGHKMALWLQRRLRWCLQILS